MVMMPAVCCPAVMSAIQFAGLAPQILDVDPMTLNIDVEAALRAQTPETSAVIAVHGFGAPCDLEGLKALGVPIVEDACLSYPIAPTEGVAATVLSFGYDKPFSAGGGGAILSDDPTFMRSCGAFLSKNEYLAEFVGDKSRLLEQFDRAAKSRAERLANTNRYLEALQGAQGIQFRYDAASVPWWRLSGLVDFDRDVLLKRALDRSLVVTTHYGNLGRFATGNELQGAQRVDKSIINLFVRPGTRSSDIHAKCVLIQEACS